MLDLLMSWTKLPLGEDRGATMVEYGLLIVLIALIAMAGALALGGGLDTLFSRIGNCLSTAPAAGC